MGKLWYDSRVNLVKISLVELLMKFQEELLQEPHRDQSWENSLRNLERTSGRNNKKIYGKYHESKYLLKKCQELSYKS